MSSFPSEPKRSSSDPGPSAESTSEDGSDALRHGFRVGDWDVQPLQGQIVRDGNQRHLEPRIMEVLVCLAKNAGEVVERESLLLQVWGERAVTDEPLTRCIAELRRALGDTRKDPRYIQTIPKRGYRLVASITVASARGEGVPPTISWYRQPLAWAGLVALVVAGMFWMLTKAPEPQLPIQRIPSIETVGPPSVAVLPLRNSSNDDDMEYFSVGITEDIINLLATIPDLRVTSRTSSFYFKDKDLDLPAIAEQLNVKNILEGSVQRLDDEIRVTVQLIDVETDTQIDALRIARPLGELFAVQDEIATAVASQLRVSLGQIPSRSRPTDDMQAHQLYLQARYQSRQRSAESMNKAIELLEKALLLDPEFGLAHEELATIYLAIPGYSQRPNDRIEVTLPKAIEEAQRATELDPQLSKPYAILAAPAGLATDFLAARVGFERALTLAPNDPEVRIWYGLLLLSVGDDKGAMEQFSWAHRVDPLSGMTNGWMGEGLWFLGRDEEAVSYLDTSIALGYINAYWDRAYAHIDRAEFDAAQELLTVWARSQGIDTDWVRAHLAAVKNPSRRDEAIQWIGRLEKAHRDIGPITYADIGALDEAFASADAAISNGNGLFFFQMMDRRMRDFRRDPRFKALVEKTGLVEYWNTHGWGTYCHLEEDDFRCD